MVSSKKVNLKLDQSQELVKTIFSRVKVVSSNDLDFFLNLSILVKVLSVNIENLSGSFSKRELRAVEKVVEVFQLK